MFQLINNILIEFCICFKHVRTWKWFMVLVFGLMIRNNHRGVTSVISSLKLNPKLYHTMLHFFRSSSYKIENLYEKWIKIALKYITIERVAGRAVVIGDHSKIPKEGRRMPGVQAMHQESDNSGKPEFIEGHNFGQVSAVITNGETSRSIPLITEMQASPPKQEGKKKPDGDTLVTQMVNLVHKAAEYIGEPVIAALDAYFCSEAAWAAADKAITKIGGRLIEIVTRAQSNSVAYTIPISPKKRKPGRPRIYGKKIRLYDLFSDMSKFTTTIMTLYGKQTTVRYLCLDLIWMPVKKPVRFVAVESGSGRCVLMSTSLTLNPEEIISVYAMRFKIETSFAEQKNDMGCFAYHFWTTALPKRKKWKKVEQPSEPKFQKKIADAKRAAESFVCLCTIATGILSIIAFSHNREILNRYSGWVRTLRSTIPTIAIVKEVLIQDFQAFLKLFPHVFLYSIINDRQREMEFFYQDVA